jgi:hypothetical protein
MKCMATILTGFASSILAAAQRADLYQVPLKDTDGPATTLKRFESKVKADSPEMIAAIETALAGKL